MSGQPGGSLKGLLVLDLSAILAGPTASRLLADLGARVVKVERPGAGDPIRSMGAPTSDGDGAWWSYVGRNKEVVSLDLTDPAGRADLLRLVAHADVLVESFRPGTMVAWGLDHDRLMAVNPRLIVLHISGFGAGGPRSERLGFGTLAEAMSGFAALNGDDEGPRLPPTGLADSVAGMQGAVAILAALYERQVSGRGQLVEVNLYEPLLGVLGGHLVRCATSEGPPWRGRSSAPEHIRGMFATADGGWIALSAHSSATGLAVAKLLGLPEPSGERQGAVQDPDHVRDRLAAWIRGQDRDAALEQLSAAGVPSAPVLAPEEVARDSQVVARGSLAGVPHHTGAIEMPGVAMDFSRSRHVILHVGRPRDADTGRILAEFSPERGERQR